MACNCNNKVKTDKPQPKLDCLCINDINIPCDEGPNPCGDIFTVDLTQYNNVEASDCDVEYSIIYFDSDFFATVNVTIDGVLTITTTDNFIKNKQGCISYKVNSPCSILSDVADILICMFDKCKNKNCDNECDPCDGECIPLEPEIQIGGSKNIDNEIRLK